MNSRRNERVGSNSAVSLLSLVFFGLFGDLLVPTTRLLLGNCVTAAAGAVIGPGSVLPGAPCVPWS